MAEARGRGARDEREGGRLREQVEQQQQREGRLEQQQEEVAAADIVLVVASETGHLAPSKRNELVSYAGLEPAALGS